MSEYKISACYFPKVGEGEFTFERMEDGVSVSLTVPLTPEQGRELVEVIGPCVYYSARLDNTRAQQKNEGE